MNSFLAFVVAGIVTASGAQALVVDSASTVGGDTNGFVGVGFTSVTGGHPAYDSTATDPASEWVWDGSVGVETLTWSWSFNFNESAYVPGTAYMSGVWSVDNTSAIYLNGTLVSQLLDGAGGTAGTVDNPSNYNQLNSFASVAGSVVNGSNLVTLIAINGAGPAGVRTAVQINADATAAVPLPASGVLLFGGLAGLGALRRRRKA